MMTKAKGPKRKGGKQSIIYRIMPSQRTIWAQSMVVPRFIISVLTAAIGQLQITFHGWCGLPRPGRHAWITL